MAPGGAGCGGAAAPKSMRSTVHCADPGVTSALPAKTLTWSEFAVTSTLARPAMVAAHIGADTVASPSTSSLPRLTTIPSGSTASWAGPRTMTSAALRVTEMRSLAARWIRGDSMPGVAAFGSLPSPALLASTITATATTAIGASSQGQRRRPGLVLATRFSSMWASTRRLAPSGGSSPPRLCHSARSVIARLRTARARGP